MNGKKGRENDDLKKKIKENEEEIERLKKELNFTENCSKDIYKAGMRTRDALIRAQDKNDKLNEKIKKLKEKNDSLKNEKWLRSLLSEYAEETSRFSRELAKYQQLSFKQISEIAKLRGPAQIQNYVNNHREDLDMCMDQCADYHDFDNIFDDIAQKIGNNSFIPGLATYESKNGVTCTYNNDGTYVVNGTPSDDTEFIIGWTSKLIKNMTYKAVGLPARWKCRYLLLSTKL